MNIPATGGGGSSGSRGPGVRQAKRKGEVREAPPASKTATVNSTTPVPVEDNASAKQVEGGEKRMTRAPQRPTRGEDSSLSLVSSSTTMVTTAAVAAGAGAAVAVASSDTSSIAPAASERQQRPREELAGLEGGGGTAASAAAEGGGEGVPLETNVKNSVTDRTTGIGLPVGSERAETTVEADVGVPLRSRANGEEVVVVAEAEASEAAAATAQATTVTGSAKTGEEAPEGGRWPATLDARWAEVEFMLCHEVESEESLQHTIEATKAGLVFMDKLEQKAQV